jgi:hypothetical protein
VVTLPLAVENEEKEMLGARLRDVFGIDAPVIQAAIPP